MTPTTRLPLVERLRQHSHAVRGLSYNGVPGQIIPIGGALCDEAAALIEKQGAVVASLIDALTFYEQAWEPEFSFLSTEWGKTANDALIDDQGERARAALLAAKTLGERE